MPPKKQAKKEVVEEPVIAAPVIPPHELSGYGRFEYSNGVTYTGQWHLFEGIKCKHGQGTLVVSTDPLTEEKYEGAWDHDKMAGFGTYTYPNGASYKGEWKNNMHHGKGLYLFPNGTLYEGEWKDHLMHGTGYLVDHRGKKWEGEFRKGEFETKLQKELCKEKELEVKISALKKDAFQTLISLAEAAAKSDKKTLKENFSPFFVVGDTVKELVKEPYPKLDERPLEKWLDALNFLKNGGIETAKVARKAGDSEVVPPEKMLSKQLAGPGQIVDILLSTPDRTVKCAFVLNEANQWLLVSFIDEEKKK